MSTIESERAWARILHDYHHSIVHVAGVDHRDTHGRKVKVMGLKEAAKTIGINKTDLSNRLNPNMPEHRATLEGFVLHLLSGMDLAALNTLESALGRVAIDVPDIEHHDNIEQELFACIKEFGDVGQSLRDATAADSDGGEAITRREFDVIHREIEGAVSELYALLAAVEEQVI